MKLHHIAGRLGRGTTAIAAAAVLFGSIAHAEEEGPVTPERFVYCTVCHGTQLMGNDLLRAPRLSGLSSWYVADQLLAFRNGWRGRHADDLVGMEMQPMTTALTNEEITAAAQFASSTVSAEPVVTIEGDPERGQALYASCAACHGADGSGNEALNAPALVGQNDWYMLHQLENYRDGRRGYVAEDTFGQQMRASVNLLDDDEALLDVVKYITTLSSQ